MKLGGITLPEQLEFGKTKMHLNGAGVRNKFFMDIYVLALYAEKSITNEKEAISGNTARALRLVITTPMANNQIVTESIEKGMRKSSGNKYELIKPFIGEIIRVFNEHPIRTRDYFDIVYIPGEGMSVYRNGKFASGPQPSDELRDTVFDNWLGSQAPSAQLKRKLLAGF
jgi:hypothetical protein